MWTLDALEDLAFTRFTPILQRMALVCVASCIFSLMPVIVPFGDPFDLSAVGFLRNSSYFLW